MIYLQIGIGESEKKIQGQLHQMSKMIDMMFLILGVKGPVMVEIKPLEQSAVTTIIDDLNDDECILDQIQAKYGRPLQ